MSQLRMSKQLLKPTRLRTHPHTTRSRLMLEVASALVNRKDFPYLQARISLREQGAADWPMTLFASDSPATVQEVADGRVQFAIINPSMMLKLAALGSAPFKGADSAARDRCSAVSGLDAFRGQTGNRSQILQRYSRAQISACGFRCAPSPIIRCT